MAKKEFDNKTALILRALDSVLRRELIKIACKGSQDTDRFHNSVVSQGFNVKHRESVYKELQTLVQADLLEKYYDTKSKKIMYRLNAERLVVDLATMQSEVVHSGSNGDGFSLAGEGA